jgi:hypothetical protein
MMELSNALDYPGQHIRLYARPLRRAYKDAGARPCAGTWREDVPDPHVDEGGGIVYRCPLNLTCGAFDAVAASLAWAASPICVHSFTAGWDGDPSWPGACKQCYSRGARLRKALKPQQF